MLIDINKYQINGIIHVGASNSRVGLDYYRSGVHKVLWFESNHANYNTLYENTRNIYMVQQYAFEDLSKTEFKNWWRNNISWCDVETYDMVAINEEKNQKEILEGFKDLFRTVNYVYFFNGIEPGLEEWLKLQGFNLSDFLMANKMNAVNNYSECLFERQK